MRGWHLGVDILSMPPQPPDLLLFDAAGTLIEPAEPVAAVYKKYFSKWGWEVGEDTLKSGFRSAFSMCQAPQFGTASGEEAERAWWRGVVAETARVAGIDPSGPAFEACFADLYSHYAAGAAWSVFPEVRQVLEAFKGRGMKMAVVSNFDQRLHQVLRELHLAEYFDLVRTSADVGARKPSPLLLEAALARLSASATRSILVGDCATADGGAAATAGMEVFILDRPRTTLETFALRVDEIFFRNELA